MKLAHRLHIQVREILRNRSGSLHNPTVIMINFDEVLNGRAREVALEPGDIVYVPPTGLTSFARIMDKITPSIQAIQTGLILSSTIKD